MSLICAHLLIVQNKNTQIKIKRKIKEKKLQRNSKTTCTKSKLHLLNYFPSFTFSPPKDFRFQ